MDFTKKDTGIGKGIAICLMIIHHLFNTRARILEGNSYIPLLVFKDIEIHIARFGKICVASFIFLSGYGLYLSFQKSDKNIAVYVINKLKKFYPVFWAQFIVFVPIGYLLYSNVTIIGQDTLRYVYDFKVILLSLFGLSSRFNGAWWFVTLYLELLILVFPIYYYLINKNIKAFFIFNAILFLISYNLDININLLLYQTSFAFGMFCAKYSVFSKPLIIKADKLNVAGIVAVICISVFLRFTMGAIYDFILAPVFIYSSIRLIKYCKMDTVFHFLGKYSFPMWINHNFFALYFFQSIMFYPKYSPLIVLSVIVTSLISSMIIEKVRITFWSRLTKSNLKPQQGNYIP
jgi:hypothetical protein